MTKREPLNEMFTELAKVNQRRIIEELSNRERSVNDLCERLNLNQPLVSKLLSALKNVDLVKYRQDGQKRMYSLNPVALKMIYEWIAPYEIFWDESLENIEIALQKNK